VPRRRAAGAWRVIGELALLVAVMAVFTWVHSLVATDQVVATENAHALEAVERDLGLAVELPANRWLAASPLLMQAAAVVYRLYYVPLVAVLLWVLLRRADVYPRVRTTLIVMAALALVTYWLVPMSPPRFALAGVVDVVAQHDPLGAAASRASDRPGNLTAMPSMHVGWSALCAYAAWLALRGAHPRAALLVWLFPLLMVAVVLTTGNHYVLDVVGSALVLLLAVGAAAAFDALGRRAARAG
jgi:hypothetical protein